MIQTTTTRNVVALPYGTFAIEYTHGEETVNLVVEDVAVVPTVLRLRHIRAAVLRELRDAIVTALCSIPPDRVF